MSRRASRAVVGFAVALAPALPPLALAGWALAASDARPRGTVLLGLTVLMSAIILAWGRDGLARQLQTVSSVLASFREGDFSIRGRVAGGDALLDEVLQELNRLGDTLRDHRLGELEAWALLRKVMAEVDVVVLACDDARRLKLANDVAARVLGKPASTLMGRAASDLGLADLLDGPVPRIVRDSSALGAGPWELRRGSFRLSGEPHSLLVVSDVRGALREQEREAWKRLIRVLGHELNNSLAPIQSISENLRRMLEQSPRPEGWDADVASGLSVVARRADALGRFMTAYARLARLPPPKLGSVDVGAWVRRTAALEQRLRVEVDGGPEVSLIGDADQLDQMLINLVKNAVEAALDAKGGVRIAWQIIEQSLELVVEDGGPGVADTANLFVPFFTTKPSGSGIGLVLVRQIAEAHGGEASLKPRNDGERGARAVVRLPLRLSGARPYAESAARA